MRQSKSLFSVLIFSFSIILFSCNPVENPASQGDPNPPADGFDLDGSDSKAIEIADQVMAAMGGRRNWDETQYVKWNFFGKRLLVWNKWTGDVRLEYPEIKATVLVNINNKKGQVMIDGQPQESIDSISKYVELGHSLWINDSYWLFMPFKLKDSGVTLKYIGQDSTQTGQLADVLQLTFTNVGKSPMHKYHVYVDKDTRLVSEWAFFNKAEDETPVFKTPWNNYSRYGRIMLSDDRGKGRLLTDIQVFEQLPEDVFLSLKPVDWNGLE